jgi:hypothetical protein
VIARLIFQTTRDDLGDAMGPKNSKACTIAISVHDMLHQKYGLVLEKDKPLECGGWSVFGHASSESHEFDRLARTIQNVDLARAWTLGEWDYCLKMSLQKGEL